QQLNNFNRKRFAEIADESLNENHSIELNTQHLDAPVCWPNTCIGPFSYHYSEQRNYPVRSESYSNFAPTNYEFSFHNFGSESRMPVAENNVVQNNSQIQRSRRTIVKVEDLLEYPHRSTRPPRIIIILRGLPGSGKSFLANKIKQIEIEKGGQKPKILSIDPYFMVEKEEKQSLNKHKTAKVTRMVYEYDSDNILLYENQLTKSVLKEMRNGLFDFIIVDSVNNQLSHCSEILRDASFCGYKLYYLELNTDFNTCVERSSGRRSKEDLLQNVQIDEQMAHSKMNKWHVLI
ncbi:hypothetical protein GJ496_004564, partial [Pomphorhynchus laevis]